MPDYAVRKDSKVEAFRKIDSKVLKIVYLNDVKFIKIVSVMWK